jgi:SAM-dependent methyltransferase
VIGQEQRFHPEYSSPEKLYISLFGVPIVGLRIRARNILNLLPKHLSPSLVLDAGSGPGVITFLLSQRYADATVVGIDQSDTEIENCRAIAQQAQITNTSFEVADLRTLSWSDRFDLIVCVDILEHIEDDAQALHTLFQALAPGGTLMLHVPSLYRRYPVFKKCLNFDVPSHERPGYDQQDIVDKVQATGFTVEDSGYTYGFLETLVNNLSYMITGARKKNKGMYALAFPFLNVLGWLGRHAKPHDLGAGVFVIGTKPSPLA